MQVDGFTRYVEWLHRMTVDFAEVVPDDRWDYSPDPAGKLGRERIPFRMGDGFAPFCKQLRHVICVRGVYNAAVVTKKADFAASHGHYMGPLTREALLAALNDKQRQLLAALETIDTEIPIDFGGTPFTFDDFACEFVQHESLHHGQWSIYASLGGFATPLSWRKSWHL